MILRSGSVQTHQPNDDRTQAVDRSYENEVTKEDKIATSLNIAPAVEQAREVIEVKPPADDQAARDIEYSRENLYHLVERGRDALEGILDLANQSQSPRAYEVAGQLIKTVTDTNRDLIDLQKKAKDLTDKGIDPRTVTNNLFVGNTAELTKLIGGQARNIAKAKGRPNGSTNK